MYKSAELYTVLDVTAITSLLDTYLTEPAIFADVTMIPQAFTGDACINYYITSPIDNNMDYGMYSRTLNCRAKTDLESRTIALAVVTAINREPITGGWVNCETLQTLPPGDDTDLFNTPLTVVIKA